MILVDTSAWIDFFRGKGPLADRVDDALASNEAALCGPILTELRRGLRSASERRRVIPLLDGCHQLEQPEKLWEEAGELGYVLARKGTTVKTLDLLIATYALSHGVALLASDFDFDDMRRAGIPLPNAL
ncbi:MAG TPA: PIN domain-containing protein [Polyangiaceae bacterium]